mmetsp:Transcript_19534/g.43500  ORF Transcript_19534/g.43500 Transcript_19534/m.43500 type:complete len:379 (+) Transcript_19534:108-1244(+)
MSADPWITLGGAVGFLVAVSLTYKFIEPNQGRDWKVHAIYWVAAICAVVFIPTSVARYMFSSLTVTLVGAVYPIYRATKAVCTPEEADDKEWLQFWMLGGVLFMLTTWVDDVIKADKADTIWLGILTFTFFWLYFPLTCGAYLVYTHITEPFIGPKVKPLQRKMNNFITYIYQTLANAVHLYLLWIIFMFLPAGLKRIVTIAVGTVYPFVCSVTAAATEEIEDDTYWLTYWAVYGCLFLIMDVLETWIGWVPGFYSVIIFSTVYLMLPMFRGADKVFRKILVPLAGLQELLMLRDSIQIKKQMLRDLDPERAKVVRKSIAKFFDNDDDDADPAVLKEEFMASWSSSVKIPKMSMPSISNPFSSKGGGGGEPTEATNLV